MTFMYLGGGATQRGEHGRRTKSDATYSKRPLSRYSIATKARRVILSIQNLLRMMMRNDFVREVFLAGCAQKGGEDVEMSMQTSSTSQNDKKFRRSRPSQSQGWV